ncbi:Histone-lysine N-methyltransferase [Bertholletia excelsa]
MWSSCLNELFHHRLPKKMKLVKFGADQECYCGAVGYRQKLAVKPGQPKVPSSDATLKIVACQVVVTCNISQSESNSIWE